MHTPEYTKRIEELILKSVDTLIWCTGSSDFGPGGIAHKGWLKTGRPLVKEILELFPDHKLGDEEIEIPPGANQ